MFENVTMESILQRMLAEVPNTVDKRVGSMIYNALAAAAAEMKQLYIELDVVVAETFADTASREYLIKRAAERGITPYPATEAEFRGVFNIEIALGSRFTAGQYVVEAIEQLDPLEYRMRAEVAGSAPNTALGAIVPVAYIDGLTSAQLTELLVPGSDEEETEALRSRYLGSFDAQAFGGNAADYKEQVNGLAGVGGCKVNRTPAGGGTVGVVIMDSTFGVPSATLIDDVQTALDPVANSGDGLGIAPIGHSVTVTGVTASVTDIATTITYAPGWDWAALEPYAQAAVDAYFLELKEAWQDEAQIIVRISQIETRLLDLAGVVDVAGTTIDTVAANKVLGVNEIPERGGLSG